MDIGLSKIIGKLNGQAIKLAKLKGDFIWHKHDHEDECFIVIKGQLIIQFRDHQKTINPGELIIVPKGVEHLPIAKDEVQIMLFEPLSTLNTGSILKRKN